MASPDVNVDESRPRPVLVLVSGSGRSGTSSLAGTLKRLGLKVPQPEVPASATNPRGFYEPQWVIDFHKRHLSDLAMHNIDSRPSAVGLVDELLATGVPQAELREWLSSQLDARQIVVKDPHAFWFASAWEEVCAELGVDLRWLTALRHPAEVVGSRDLAYLQTSSDELRLVKETSNVAGWVHAALLTERVGRGHQRSFVRYVDLLADWRAALAPVAQQLHLEFNTDLSRREEHDVDAFLEPSMRKSQLTWADVRIPDWLKEMAEEVWTLLGDLAARPDDSAAQARLDEIHTSYVARYTDAVALTFDHHKAESVRSARKAREAQRETVERLRREVADLSSRPVAPPANEQSPGQVLGQSVGSTLGSLLARAKGRLRRD